MFIFQGIMFVNNSSSRLSWSLDLEKGGPYIDDGTFRLLHRTGSPYQLAMENKNLTVPETFLHSGETAQLGILFTPSMDFPLVRKLSISLFNQSKISIKPSGDLFDFRDLREGLEEQFTRRYYGNGAARQV